MIGMEHIFFYGAYLLLYMELHLLLNFLPGPKYIPILTKIDQPSNSLHCGRMGLSGT